MPAFQEKVGASLLQLEEDCRIQLNGMKTHKKQNCDKLQTDVNRELMFCNILCSTPLSIDPSHVLSMEQQDGYRSNFADLVDEKRRWHQRFCASRSKSSSP
ncbi:hypothetical protein NHX12_031022 [Muraenolepis orangiensis]|uniref:Uncharacterized protein n=1 Tax=Muraenolepis orangiensis TaxID=630683 RepID=A0A9Q0IM66_9TELE|nr:hypothetical protein NHX12_031022 [Muraenolepis orangiensis]